MLYSHGRFLRLLRLRGAFSQKRTGLRDPGEAISIGEYSKMSDLDEAQRQDVQTKAAQELLERERHRSDLTAVGVVFVAKGDRALLQIHSLQATVGDGHAVSVAAQIRQNRLRTGKRPFGVNRPSVATKPTQPAGEDNRV